MKLVDLISEKLRGRADSSPSLSDDELLFRLEQGAKTYRCGVYLHNLESIHRQQIYQELETERLKSKYHKIWSMHEEWKMSWNHIFLVGFFDSLSDMENRENYLELAVRLNYSIISRERKSLRNLEALLIGMSGLLELLPRDRFTKSLADDARFIIHKYQLNPLPATQWNRRKWLPFKHPIVRLSQVAHLLYENEMPFNSLIECRNRNDIHNLFNVEMSEWWNPYFGESVRHIGVEKSDLLGINFVVPMLYAFGHYSSDDEMTNRANDLNEDLPAESNFYITKWRRKGLDPKSAYETQALIQLAKIYCSNKHCEECHLYRHMKSKSSILSKIPAFLEELMKK
ncbi:MAG: DUF2851 family protein [Rikenellaceae bacterium]